MSGWPREDMVSDVLTFQMLTQNLAEGILSIEFWTWTVSFSETVSNKYSKYSLVNALKLVGKTYARTHWALCRKSYGLMLGII